MKFDSVIVRDAEGERRFDSERLPLRLGTSGDCDLRLPGPGSNVVALIDRLDGEPFIQPAAREAGLQVNGESLHSSQRLEPGDELEYFGTRVVIGGDGGALTLTVRLEDSAYVTRPPEEADAGQAAEETIAPSAFQRAAEVRRAEPPRKVYRWQTAVGIAVVALVAISYLLFTSTSIQFEVQPGEPDELSVTGGWFRLPLADRMLLREGSYTVRVRKQGFYDVNMSLQVADAPSRTVLIEMRKLPGQLDIITDPETDAVVTVNRTMVGEAPFGPVELEPGTHVISVRADDYLPYEHKLTVPGLGKTQHLSVQLVPRWAEITLVTEPAGATVFRGDKQLAETPATLRLDEGSHDLTVIKEGFRA